MNKRQLDAEEPARRGEEDSIGGSRLGPSKLAAKHRQFVAEHDDLEFLELVRTKTQDGELQDTPDQQVADRAEHEGNSSSDKRRAADSTDRQARAAGS
jgi:hypothetical protein